MLTPNQLKEISESLEELFAELEEFVISDIARRIGDAGGLTDTAEAQISKALGIGIPLDSIEREIQRATNAAIRDIDHTIRDAVSNAEQAASTTLGRGIGVADSPIMKQLLEAGIAQTTGELRNFTQSLGFAFRESGRTVFKPIARFYQNTLDLAAWQVSTGVTDYNTATRNAIKKMAQSGLKTIDYATGHVNRVDVAARRAILTGVNQMNLRMTDQLMNDLGAEYVEVSAHMGARPSHQVWQGLIYHVGGDKGGYPDFVSSTGYGTGDGLGGWNCRHTYFPFMPNIMKPTYTAEQLSHIDPPPRPYKGKEYTYYEATQQQRRMETSIRQTKNEAIGYKAAGLDKRFTEASIKLQQQKEAYRQFSRAMNIRPRLERTQLLGFGRSIAQKARHAPKLTRAERLAINQYISGAAYKINEKLRRAMILTEAEKKYIKDLDDALSKFPKYKGDLSRSLFFMNDAAKSKFLSEHLEGGTIRYREYISATKGDTYNPKGQVQIHILSQNGRDISKYNKAEQEVLFRRNSRFKIVRVKVIGHAIHIAMKEV